MCTDLSYSPMLSGMSVSTLKSPNASQVKKPFRKVGENLYRLIASGTYYALLKRGGKQIRKSLGTKDKELAIRKLAELRKKVGRKELSSESVFDLTNQRP